MRSTPMLGPKRHLTVREAAVVYLAALEARGAVFWLTDDGCMAFDLTPCGCQLRPDEYAEGLGLLRDEIQRSWPPLSSVLH